MMQRTRAGLLAGLFLIALIPAITATTPAPTDNLLTFGNVAQTSSATGSARWTSAAYDGDAATSDRWYTAGAVKTDTCGTNVAHWSEWRFLNATDDPEARSVDWIFVDARSAVTGSGFLGCLSIYGLEANATWSPLAELGYSPDGARTNQTVQLGTPTEFYGIRYSVSRLSGISNGAIGVEIYETGVYGGRPPAAIADLEATNKTHAVELTWSAPSPGSAPISSYTIQRDGTTVATITNTTPTTYTYETAETPTANHVWTVTAANQYGTAPPANVTAHAADAPAAPTNFSAIQAHPPTDANWLQWTTAQSERPQDGHAIYKIDLLESSYTLLATPAANATTHTDGTGTGSQRAFRCYVVTASSDGIEGTPSAPASRERLDCPAF